MERKFIIGATDAITAFKVSNNRHVDYIWASSFIMSAMLGLRDDGIVNIKTYLPLIRAFIKASRCPVILDFDVGGKNVVDYKRNLLLLKKIKIGGVCIEDEHWPKVNAILDHGGIKLISPSSMAEKIRTAKKILGRRTLVIARTHSLLIGEDRTLLQKRVNEYQSAGADVLCIHYTGKTWERYKKRLHELTITKPLMLILSRRNDVPRCLSSQPLIRFILYPNQLYRMMVNTAVKFSHWKFSVNIKEYFVNRRMVRVDELFSIIRKINATD